MRDDKAVVRLDANTRWGLLSAYYFIDDFGLDNPYPTAQSGASVPGFDALTTGRAQLLALGATKMINSTTVNESHLSYLRDITNLGQPVGGRAVSLVSQGFANADGTPSIVALDPKGQSVENLNFNGYSIGAAANQLIQANNTYQATDTFSKVVGSHTMKFGGEFHVDQVNAHPIAQFNGSFVFSGTETGVDFADFLIGVPSQYNQSQLNPFYARNKYVGLFAQDSWHARPSLTLNYGLRWDRIAPWTEKYNQISTFVAGAQSVVFPGAPAGFLSRRSGSAAHAGAGGQSRILAARGRGVVAASGVGRSRSCWARRERPAFARALGTSILRSMRSRSACWRRMRPMEPRIRVRPRRCSQRHLLRAADGTNYGQPFPYTFAPLNSSRSHPDGTFDWGAYEPISGIPGYDVHNRVPYTEEWMLSIERQAGPETVLARAISDGEPPAARADRAEPGQPGALPEPEPAQRGATGDADLRRGRRRHGLLPDWRRAGEWNARTAGSELRQQCAAIEHRPRELQRA